MKTLFNPPLARDTDVITSHIAAEKMINSGALNRQEQELYEAILRNHNYFKDKTEWPTFMSGQPGGFTAKEIEYWSYGELNYYQIQRRLSGLHNKGKIERLNTEGGVYIEGQKLMKRDGCAVWRLV